MEWDELCDFFLDQYQSGTRTTYRYALKEFTQWCADRGVVPLRATRANQQSFLNDLLNRHAQATAGLRFGAIAGLFKLAVEEELIEKNPCLKVKSPRIDRAKQKRAVLSPLEFAAFLKTAEEMGPTEHGIAALGGMLGLRSQEILSLTASSLGTTRGYATILVDGKGGRTSLIPLPVPVMRPIALLAELHPQGPLIRSHTGHAMNRSTLIRRVRRIAAQAGITRDITTHGLRRTFATSGFMKGVPLRDMQIAMRHVRSETTLLYDLDRQNLDRHASHEIAAFLSGFVT